MRVCNSLSKGLIGGFLLNIQSMCWISILIFEGLIIVVDEDIIRME